MRFRSTAAPLFLSGLFGVAAVVAAFVLYVSRDVDSVIRILGCVVGAVTFAILARSRFLGARAAYRVENNMCVRCGYLLTGLPDRRCPECGYNN